MAADFTQSLDEIDLTGAVWNTLPTVESVVMGVAMQEIDLTEFNGSGGPKRPTSGMVYPISA